MKILSLEIWDTWVRLIVDSVSLINAEAHRFGMGYFQNAFDQC